MALSALILLGGASFAHAGLIGRELSVGYYYPEQSIPYDGAIEILPTFIVGSGIESIVDVEGVTTIAVDVSDASILFDFTTALRGPRWETVPFNGLVFNLLSGAPLEFISFSIDPSSTFEGFDLSRISFTGSEIAVNWQGLSYDSDTLLRINFDLPMAEVPEPATLSLLGLGILGAVAIRRRRPETPVTAASHTISAGAGSQSEV